MYHYICLDCGHEWEEDYSLEYHDLMGDDMECPKCESDNIDDDGN